MSLRVRRISRVSLSGSTPSSFSEAKSPKTTSTMTTELWGSLRYEKKMIRFILIGSDYCWILFQTQGAIKIYKLPLPRDLNDHTVMGE